MAEYIEREVVLKATDILDDFLNDYERLYFVKAIKNIPTADVVEVVHGEWINDFGSYSTMHCSKCEWRVPYIEDYWAIQELYSSLHNCPNCGAKMDGEKNEAN